VAATLEIVIKIGFHLSSFFNICEVLTHWEAAHVTRSEGSHTDLNSCFLSLKRAVFGAISFLIQLAPSFPGCSSKLALLSRSCWTALCSSAFPLLLGKHRNPELGSQQLSTGNYTVHLLASTDAEFYFGLFDVRV